jgi:hypothetical protein
MIEHLKLLAKRNLAPKRLVNAAIIMSFAFALLTNIWSVGHKVDETLSYLKEIPKLRHELAQLRHEKDATRDSLRFFRMETSAHFMALETNLGLLNGRITGTNQNVKMEFKKMNDYLIVIGSDNAEIKRLLMIKKENDNALLDQLFTFRNPIRF